MIINIARAKTILLYCNEYFVSADPKNTGIILIIRNPIRTRIIYIYGIFSKRKGMPIFYKNIDQT